jgi:hypothetical protein
MPDELRVSAEPSITFDGTTTTLTYKITADFSRWPENSLNYTADGQPSSASAPQSIDALIHYYGEKSLFGTVVSGDNPLVTTGRNGNLPPYVIIPLDTSLIRDHLKKRLQPPVEVPENDEDADIPLVWIEENLTIGKVETVDTTDNNNWKDAVYEADGIRVGGCYISSSATPPANGITVSTVENFDDGDDGRIRSIATVLADEKDRDKKRYTSAINFYANKEAKEIERELPGTSLSPSGTLDSARALEIWMRTNKPELRVVYQWAD